MSDKYAALRAAAEKATPGRIGDRIDGSGSIKYQCKGYDGSLVLQTDHKDMEYGFIGDNGDADEFFFRECVPDVILSLLAEREADKARIDALQYELGRYSMSAGEADQRRCESHAVRDALGFGKDADDVSPADLRQRIAELESRKVTVNLPPEVQSSNIPFAADGANAMRKEMIKAWTEACAAAGITLETGE